MKKNAFSKQFLDGYFKVMGIALACIVCGLAVFWLYLDRHEKALPYHTADRVFAMCFAGPDYDVLYAQERHGLSVFETKESYISHVRRKAEAGERLYRSVPSGEDSIKKYGVYADNVRFAEFELTQNGGSAWRLSGLRATLDCPEDAQIVVPTDSVAYINGRMLGDTDKIGSLVLDDLAGSHDVYAITGMLLDPEAEMRYREGGTAPLEYVRETNSYMPQMREITADILEGGVLYIGDAVVGDAYRVDTGIEMEETAWLNMRYDRYQLAGRFGGRSPKAVGPFGWAGVLEALEDGRYVQKIPYDEALELAYSTLAKDAAMAYAKYMTNDSSMAEVRRYFATGTAIYDAIRTSEVIWYTNHIGYSFENVIASAFVDLGEGGFACRVTLDHYIQRTAVDTRYFPLDITLFFSDVNGRPLVTDLISNA